MPATEARTADVEVNDQREVRLEDRHARIEKRPRVPHSSAAAAPLGGEVETERERELPGIFVRGGALPQPTPPYGAVRGRIAQSSPTARYENIGRTQPALCQKRRVSHAGERQARMCWSFDPRATSFPGRNGLLPPCDGDFLFCPISRFPSPPRIERHPAKFA